MLFRAVELSGVGSLKNYLVSPDLVSFQQTLPVLGKIGP